MATQEQIEEARSQGYTDDEIVAFLAKRDPRIQHTLNNGVSAGAILQNIRLFSDSPPSQPPASEDDLPPPGIPVEINKSDKKKFVDNFRNENFVNNIRGVFDTIKDIGGNETFGEFALRSFVDSLLNIPEGAGEGLALASAGIGAVAEQPFTEEGLPGLFGKKFRDRFNEKLDIQRGNAATKALNAVGEVIPETGQIMAGTQTGRSFLNEALGKRSHLTGGPADRFNQAELLQSIRDEALRQVKPLSTGAGDIAGDVATLATLRAPIAKLQGRRALEEPVAEAKDFLIRREKALERAGMKASEFNSLPIEVQQRFNGIVTDKIIPFLKFDKESLIKAVPRGLRKVRESALEAATLALLNEGDPVQMAGFAAGAQGAGSLALTLTDKILLGKKGERASRLLLAFGSGFLIHEMLKSAGPGDQSFFESKDFAVQTLVAAYSLGTMAALTGAGRVRGVDMQKFPVFMDTLTQAGRTISRETFVELLDGKRSDSASWKVLQKMALDPVYFNEDQMISLGRALNNNKPGAFTKEVERLIENSPSFRKKVDDL